MLSLTPLTFVNAEVFQERLEGTLDVYTNQLVFAPGEPIFVHGQGMPKEPIIIRLFIVTDDAGHAVSFLIFLFIFI